MIKKYAFYFVFALVCFSGVSAQSGKQNVAQKTELNFYPNPVTDGKIYITSNTSTTSNKEIEIFDVLGKSVLKTTVVRELNISSLTAGVYLIKIKEGDNVATRKLIIK